MSEQLKNSFGESERIRRNQSKDEFSELIETCFEDGWFPTKCPEGCVVEPDGICPHDYRSIALELGLI